MFDQVNQAGNNYIDLMTTVANSSAAGKRITELAIPWTDIAGSEATSVGPGYAFRCDPLLIDSYNGFNWADIVQSFVGGGTWYAPSSGSDITFIKLVCNPGDLNSDCM